MKLPDDKKERTKILVLIGIGAVIVVGLILKAPVIGILPVLKSKKDKLEKIAKLNTDLASANKEIKQHLRDKAENLDILEKIGDISQKHVLKPVLGNYKIPASEVIEPIAKKQNLKIEQFRQIGISAEAAQTVLRAFSARVYVICSYDDLKSLIAEIENSNPLLCILNISIAVQGPESPEGLEKHQAYFDVQWPIWADAETPSKLLQQLKDLIKTPGSGAK